MPWVDLNRNPPGKAQSLWLHEFYISVIFQHMFVKESNQWRDLSSSISARWEEERWASWFKRLAGTEEMGAEFLESASDFPACQRANPCRDICVGNSSLHLSSMLSTSGFLDSTRRCSWVAKLYWGAPQGVGATRTGLQQAGRRTGKEVNAATVSGAAYLMEKTLDPEGQASDTWGKLWRRILLEALVATNARLSLIKLWGET